MNKAFRLAATAAFDARKGYARWVPSGVVTHLHRHPQVSADLWTDRDGRLVVRFSCVLSCVRYVDHFQIVLASGAATAEAQEDEFVTWLSDKMAVWSVDDFEAECVWND